MTKAIKLNEVEHLQRPKKRVVIPLELFGIVTLELPVVTLMACCNFFNFFYFSRFKAAKASNA